MRYSKFRAAPIVEERCDRLVKLVQHRSLAQRPAERELNLPAAIVDVTESEQERSDRCAPGDRAGKSQQRVVRAEAERALHASPLKAYAGVERIAEQGQHVEQPPVIRRPGKPILVAAQLAGAQTGKRANAAQLDFLADRQLAAQRVGAAEDEAQGIAAANGEGFGVDGLDQLVVLITAEPVRRVDVTRVEERATGWQADRVAGVDQRLQVDGGIGRSGDVR